MRKVSPWATWVFARLGWSPNAVTVTFIACGVAAGVFIAVGGLVTAIVAAILIQAALLFDCSDGELARWSKRTSATGVYLDRLGHYAVDTALLAGLGIRAQGHLTADGSFVAAGLAAALGHFLADGLGHDHQVGLPRVAPTFSMPNRAI